MRVLVRDLTPGQAYVIQFRARTATDVSEWSPKMDLVTSTDVLAPKAVTGLTAEAVGTAFKVRWDKVTQNTNGTSLLDFKDYEIEVVNNNASNDTETFFVTGEVFNLTFEDNKNAFGTASPNLTFKVRARDKNYNAVATPAQATATNPPPAAPTNFTAQAVVNAINFEWDGAADEDIKSYRVYTGPTSSDTNMKIYDGLSENFTFSSTDTSPQWFRVASVDVFGQQTLITTAIAAAPLAEGTGDTVPPASPVWATEWFSAEPAPNPRAMLWDITLTWQPNQESDLSSYLVQFKKVDDLIWSEVTVSGDGNNAPPNSLKINGLADGETYNFRLAARDTSGNTSIFVPDPGGGTTVEDTTAPGIPSTPVVSNYLGVLNVIWDGLDSTGAPMVEDTELVEVHLSTTSNFTPSSTTMTAVFPNAYTGGRQEAIIADLPYGVVHYVKLIAQDYSGNRSAPSGQSSGTPERISGLDIENGSLSTDQINFDARDLGASVAFYQAAQPTTGMLENDIWYDTDDNYKMYVYKSGAWQVAYDARIDSYDSRITNAENTANSAQTTADGKNAVYYSNVKPSGGTYADGDIWFDTANGNRIYVYDTTINDFVDAHDVGIDTALSDAASAASAASAAQAAANNAQATADGKVRTFFQAAAPTGMVSGDVGDLWFDTDDGNKMYRWTGSTWAASDDQRISEALTTATDAENLADTKITTFYQAAAPTAMSVGDLWVDTDNDNILSRWDGTAWIQIRDAGIAEAQADADSAYTLASGKNTVYVQSAVPTGGTYKIGDVWIRSSDNLIHTWDGSSFVTRQDAAITDAQSTADTALSTANGKNKVTFSTAAPGTTANSAGDIWFQKNASNIIIGQWEGTGGTAWSQKTIDNAVIANINAGKITAGTISADRIGANSITTEKIAAGSITAASGIIADAAIVSAKIADAAITTAKIQDGQITNAKIADATIDNAKIATLDAGKITTGTLAAARIGADTITGDKIAAGSIVTEHMTAGAINGDRITAGTLHASKITAGTITSDQIGSNLIITAAANIGNAVIDAANIATVNAASITTGALNAGVKITVGNASGSHVDIGASGPHTGIMLFGTDGTTTTFKADATTGDVFGAGTFQSPDYMEARQGWRIAPGGEVEFQRANVVGDLAADNGSFTNLDVAGVPFSDHFPDVSVLPRGPIAVETLPVDISGLGSTSGQGVARIVLQAEQGRWYRVVWNAQRVELSATDSTTFIFNISFTYDGSLATTNSELLQYQFVSNTMNRNRSMYMERVFRILGGSAMRLNLLFWVQRAAGSATLKLYSGGSSFVVEDLGANVDTPQVLSTDFRTGTTDPGSGSTSPATKEYVKDYYATWVRTWNSDGSVHSDEDAYQGEYPGYGGNRRSLIGFDDAQIRADLSGAEVLGCDVYLRNRHTYYASGGTAVIGTHNHSSKPASYSGTITTNQWQKSHSKGAWLSQPLGTAVGDQFKSGTRRGIAIGPAPSTSVSWYGYYYGTGSNRPYLKIRYRK